MPQKEKGEEKRKEKKRKENKTKQKKRKEKKRKEKKRKWGRKTGRKKVDEVKEYPRLVSITAIAQHWLSEVSWEQECLLYYK